MDLNQRFADHKLFQVSMTPAMAAGVEQSQWSVAELIERCGE
jgi:hypothetical protein